jgi:hypothetical protein
MISDVALNQTIPLTLGGGWCLVSLLLLGTAQRPLSTQTKFGLAYGLLTAFSLLSGVVHNRYHLSGITPLRGLLTGMFLTVLVLHVRVWWNARQRSTT